MNLCLRASFPLVAAMTFTSAFAPICRADHVLFVRDIVDRSTIEVFPSNEGGKLALEFHWGAGVQRMRVKLKYDVAYESPAAKDAIRALLDLLRDEKVDTFGDPELTTKIGLGDPKPMP